MEKNKAETLVELAIPSNPEYLRVVRLLVSGFLSRLPVSVDEVENMKVAVSEACNNAMQHAYEGDSDGRILIKCSEADGYVVFEVTDQGSGMKSLEEDEMTEGGLGFLLIQTLVDEVNIDTESESGTTITMKKKLSAA